MTCGTKCTVPESKVALRARVQSNPTLNTNPTLPFPPTARHDLLLRHFTIGSTLVTVTYLETAYFFDSPTQHKYRSDEPLPRADYEWAVESYSHDTLSKVSTKR